MEIIFMPLIVSFFSSMNYLIGSHKLNKVNGFIFIWVTFFFWDILLLNIINGLNYTIVIGEWFGVYNFNIQWEFTFNVFTLSTGFVVMFIATHIQLYSISYMHSDINSSKFLGYLSLFTFFMLFGISGNNLLQLFIGWEGVGIMSYLLINFYDTRLEANKSGIKALLFNKIGDGGLLLGILAIYATFVSLKFNNVNTLAFYFKYETVNFFYYYEIYFLTLVAVFFIIGVSTKSAQLLFNSWLPDAMEGPTPVSALIHSATMVGIGFLLLLKLSLFFQNSGFALLILIGIGGFTSFLTSLGGLVCYDAKSINANSTGSQLSFMLLSYGSANFSAGFFHFTTHAHYKATAFLASGLMIQQWGNLQDLRKVSPMLKNQLPVAGVGILAANTSLIGLPSSLGSCSKEYIFEINYSEAFSFTLNNWILTLLSAILTTVYTSLVVTAGIDYKHISLYKKTQLKLFCGEPAGLTHPIIGLSLFCLTSSDVINSLFTITTLFDNSLMINNTDSLQLDYLFGYWYIKILPLLSIITVFFFIWCKGNFKILWKYSNYNIPNVNKFATGLILDKFYNTLLIKIFWWCYFTIFRLVNNKIFNPYNYVHFVIMIVSFSHSFLNRNNLNFYLMIWVYFGLVCFLSII